MPTLTPTIQHLLRRYGIPGALLVLGYVPTPLYVAMPIAALWIFWLVAREPPAQRINQKLLRLAIIFVIMTLPTAVFFYLIWYLLKQGGDNGEALGVIFILVGPWAAVPLAAGLIAMLVVLFQKRPAPTGLEQPVPQ